MYIIYYVNCIYADWTGGCAMSLNCLEIDDKSRKKGRMSELDFLVFQAMAMGYITILEDVSLWQHLLIPQQKVFQSTCLPGF